MKIEIDGKAVTATQARKNLFQLLKDIQQSHVPAEILYKDESFFVVDEASWQAMQKKVGLKRKCVSTAKCVSLGRG